MGDGPEVREEKVLPQPVEGRGAQVLRHFLPAGDLDALGLGDVQYAGNEIVLEFVDVLQALFFHQGLAGGGALPRALRHLVAANVHRLQRHAGLLVQGDDPVEDFVQERVGGREGDVQGVVREILRRDILGGVLRFGQQVGPVPGRPGPVVHRLDGGAGVSRGVELRNHADPALPGVAEQVDVVGLRIIAVGGRFRIVPVQRAAEARHHGVLFVDAAILLQFRNAPECPVGGEFGKTVNLHAPALVVPQVEVQVVQLVVGHDVQEPLHVLFPGEVPAYIQHDAAVGKVRAVLDDRGGNLLPGGIAAQVLHRDRRPESAVLIGRLHFHRILHGNPVPPRLPTRNDRRIRDIDLAEVHGPIARGDAFETGNHVISRRFHGIIGEGLHGLGGQEDIFQLHGNRFSPLLLEIEGLRRPAPVHQGPRLVAERHGLALRVRGRNHPVQRAGDMVDAAGRAFLHLDGGAELAEPEGPVRPGGRIQDFQPVDGRPGFGIGGPFGPADRTGLRARACQ